MEAVSVSARVQFNVPQQQEYLSLLTVSISASIVELEARARHLTKKTLAGVRILQL